MKREIFTAAALIAGTACAGEFGGVIKGTSGFKADFKSPSASGVYANDPGTLAPDTNHEYDDGYVRDNLLSAGSTPDWGFNSKSQVTPIGGNYNNGATIEYSSQRTLGAGVNDSERGEAQAGFELFYRAVVWESKRHSVGWLVGATYQRADIEMKGRASFATETTTDLYTYTGVFPNVGNPLFPAPYDNTDPALLLPDGAARTITGGTRAYDYSRKVEADLFGLKAGPVWRMNLYSELTLGVSAGATAQRVESTFSYRDGASSGSTSDGGWIFGGYVQADMDLAVGERWRLFFGVECTTQESFSQKVDGYESELKGSPLISGRVGVAISF